MAGEDSKPTTTAGADDSSAERAPTVRYAERLLGDARQELHRADTKASILLAGAGAVILAFVTAVLAGGWSPARLTGPRELLWWAGTAAAVTAVILMGAAVYPRIGRRGSRFEMIAYYIDITSFREPAAFRHALEQTTVRELEQLIDQLMYVSRLVLVKYRLLALGMWAMLAAVFGCCLALMLQALVS